MQKNLTFVALALALFMGAGCQGAGAYSDANATVVDLHDDGLAQVPSWVFENTGIEELDVSDNQLTGALPGEIRQLSHLRILNASGNEMTGVPAEIGQLSSLEVLDLSDNQLTGLPLELGNLQHLRVLDLRGNDISVTDLAAIRGLLVGTDILYESIGGSM